MLVEDLEPMPPGLPIVVIRYISWTPFHSTLSRLGPLYHLIERTDRLRALSEARRVLRPGGWVFVAGISRYAALLDLLVRLGKLHEPQIFEIVKTAVETGVFRGQRLFAVIDRAYRDASD